MILTKWSILLLLTLGVFILSVQGCDDSDDCCSSCSSDCSSSCGTSCSSCRTSSCTTCCSSCCRKSKPSCCSKKPCDKATTTTTTPGPWPTRPTSPPSSSNMSSSLSENLNLEISLDNKVENKVEVTENISNMNIININVAHNASSDWGGNINSTFPPPTIKPQPPITIRIPYPVPHPVPVPMPYPVRHHVPVPVPVHIPVPSPVHSGCCHVYQPCTHSHCSSHFSIRQHCSERCTSSYMYRPINPCIHRPCHQSWSHECSTCNINTFYTDFQEYHRCHGCF